MVEYKKLPHGTEMISTIGLGLGNIHTCAEGVVEETVRYAAENGINFFDLCCGTVGTYKAFGNAVRGRRDRIYTQMHFGAAYPKGEYEFSRNEDIVKKSFDTVLEASGLEYTDFGYMHCIDEWDDLR